MEIERAIAIALQAHAGQTDKGGQPYILHPLRVMMAAATPDERVVAVLHDVVEDSDWTLPRLMNAGLTPVQAAALDAVTRRAGESYETFVARAGADALGRRVKMLDLRDNCDLTRIPAPGGADAERRARYRRALAMLEGLEGPDLDR